MVERWRVVAAEPLRGTARPSDALTFSVIIAAFQAEQTLAAAVDSVLAQTRPPRDIVVCDDGSTDATADVARSYGSVVRLVRQPNSGEAAAKNSAVAAAAGEFVAVLDADDVYLPERLEALTWLGRRRPDLDILLTDAHLRVGGEVIGRAYHTGWPFECHDQPREILRRNFVLGLAAIRRQRWLDIGGFDEAVRLTADWDFFIRLIRSGSRAGLVAAPLAEYRLAAGSLSADRTALVESRIGTLERAQARGGLTLDERRVIEESLAAQRRELAVRRAKSALLDRTGRARGQLLSIARDPTFRPSRRAAAALAAGAPALVGTWLRARAWGAVEVGTGASISVRRAARR